MGQEPAKSGPALSCGPANSSENSNSSQQVIRHESPRGTATHHQKCHVECHRSWQWRRNSRRCHRRRHCGRRQSPDRDVQTVHVRHQALIVLTISTAESYETTPRFPCGWNLSSPWRLSLNNLAMARRTGRSPHLPNHCRVIPGRVQIGGPQHALFGVSMVGRGTSGSKLNHSP